MDKTINLNDIIGAASGEHSNMLGKFLYFSLSNVLVDKKELEKLFCYTLDRDEITAEDVEAVCTAQTANRIFDMVEAVAMKRQKKALDYYYDLLALREPPMRIGSIRTLMT